MTTSKTQNSGAPSFPSIKNSAIKTRIPGNKWFPGVLTWSDPKTCKVDGRTIHIIPCSVKIGDGTRIWIDLSFVEGSATGERKCREQHAQLLELSRGKSTFAVQLYLTGYYESTNLSAWTAQYAAKAKACGAKVGEPLALIKEARVENLG